MGGEGGVGWGVGGGGWALLGAGLWLRVEGGATVFVMRAAMLRQSIVLALRCCSGILGNIILVRSVK